MPLFCWARYQVPYSAYGNYQNYCTIFGNGPNTLNCDSCEIEKTDRGWFKRAHKECELENCHELNAYPLVLAYAIACGGGWFLAGIFGMIGGVMVSKCWAIVTGTMFSVFYAIFIGLFAGAWVRIKNYETLCINFTCEQYMKKIKRSTYEFLGYSICSFMLILFSILFSFIAACSIKESTTTNRTLQAQNTQRNNITNRSNWANAYLNQYMQSTTHYKNSTNQSAIQPPNYLSTSEYLPEYYPQPLQHREVTRKKQRKREIQHPPNAYTNQTNQYPLHSVQYPSTNTQGAAQEIFYPQNHSQYRPQYYNEY
jgi:hypothetical protein